jgi:site-specific DNA-cytosine methylase
VSQFNKVLVINSYAGSITLAATQAGFDILASMEDSGYALGTQKLNFPRLTYIDQLPWPMLHDRALADCIVAAHPPCAAFSAQNNSTNKGVNSSHFNCTKRVLDYSAAFDAAAIVIESVTGAYLGAKDFYDEWASSHPYDCYRILQNACTFGVPQWRPRYWTVMVRKGLINQLILRHTRKYVTLGEALGTGIEGEKNPYTEKYWSRQCDGLKTGGMTNESIRLITTEFTGHLGRTIAAVEEADIYETKLKYNISSFDSHVFTMLPLDGFAHTVMCVSNWLYLGRPVNMPELNVIAGFPADYKFDKPREQKCYLSKGVAPPVAKWLLEEVRSNLQGETLLTPLTVNEYVYEIKPGETADMRVKKAEVKQRNVDNLFVDNVL